MPPHRHHPPHHPPHPHHPHHRPPPPPHRRRHVPPSAISAFIHPEDIEAILAPWVPDPKDRAFVARCMVQEGPAHHRGANYVILSLLGEVLERLKVKPGTEGKTLPLPMRLPPHLEHEQEEANFPLHLPLEPLEYLAGEHPEDAEAMADCLTDGPPQHAIANVAMVCLLGAILKTLPDGEP